MKHHLLLLIPLLGVGCAHPSHIREVTTKSGLPAFVHVHDDDAEMNRAVKKARKTVGEFIAAVQHPTTTQRDFEVKKPFVYKGGVEHIWLSNIEFHGGHFHGRVDNQPNHLPDVKMGDRVSVKVNEITDWSYVDKDTLVGGYTIRILVRDLTPEQKKIFESEANYHVTKN
jgi:uncharacterized protein YegJ (DUF2314 family)